MPKGIKTCEMVRWNTDGLEALPALDTFHPSHFVTGSVLATSLFCTHVSSFLPVQNRVYVRRYFKRLLQLLEIIDELLLSFCIYQIEVGRVHDVVVFGRVSWCMHKSVRGSVCARNSVDILFRSCQSDKSGTKI